MENQLDVVSFLKGQLMLRRLLTVQFSPLELYLAKRQRKSFLLERRDSEISSASSSSKEEVNTHSDENYEAEDSQKFRKKHKTLFRGHLGKNSALKSHVLLNRLAEGVLPRPDEPKRPSETGFDAPRRVRRPRILPPD